MPKLFNDINKYKKLIYNRLENSLFGLLTFGSKSKIIIVIIYLNYTVIDR